MSEAGGRNVVLLEHLLKTCENVVGKMEEYRHIPLPLEFGRALTLFERAYRNWKTNAAQNGSAFLDTLIGVVLGLIVVTFVVLLILGRLI